MFVRERSLQEVATKLMEEPLPDQEDGSVKDKKPEEKKLTPDEQRLLSAGTISAAKSQLDRLGSAGE